MKLIALMLIRNEQWCIGASLRMALRWCDEAFVLLDRCTDDTEEIVGKIAVESGGRVSMGRTEPAEVWLEMDDRQRTLEMGRGMGGTHFAIVDGDEVLTANLFGRVREWFEMLKPGDLLELPRLAMSDLDHYWDDGSEHADGGITLGFMDTPHLCWKPRGPGAYHFHQRPPVGSGPTIHAPLGRDKAKGGVLHLSYANRPRNVLKHFHYVTQERLRWPNRKTLSELNSLYSAALVTPSRVASVREHWWGEERTFIRIDDEIAWYLSDIEAMIHAHGACIVEGVNVGGWTWGKLKSACSRGRFSGVLP